MSVSLLLGFIFTSMVHLAQIQSGAVQLAEVTKTHIKDIQRLH